MTPELTVLTLAALLQVVQFLLMAIPVNLELGTAKTMSPRDPDRMGGPMVEQVKPKTARLVRALNNHFEGLILFGIACTVITVSGQSSALTATCAWIYLAARIAYVPAYYFGLVPWRSLIWAIGFGATTLMLVAALI
ncbi:MAPEG family protein [Roseovarius sp. D0-M9]|uniref:MAPEG family protein n=1 Tax=Roseovarius sp. D0-M9 TaxID=3127117 RepID=UPI00300FD5BB